MTREERWLLEEKHGGVATAAFAADRERLAAGEPVAYVIGHQPFLGLRIHLDSRPLIPRPETEWWTNELLSALAAARSSETAGHSAAVRLGQAARSVAAECPAVEQLSFLDLCAGSGAIGCAALARLPEARVFFGEINPEHEATIRKNIRENALDEARATVRIGDLFEPFGDARIDVIAANPPYVPASRALPESVASYEPAEALYAGEDGLAVVRRIAAELPRHLAPDGIAWVECDRAHAEIARALFEGAGMRARVIPDQYGAPRILAVSFP